MVIGEFKGYGKKNTTDLVKIICTMLRLPYFLQNLLNNASSITGDSQRPHQENIKKQILNWSIHKFEKFYLLKK